jgi:hypothetical protein
LLTPEGGEGSALGGSMEPRGNGETIGVLCITFPPLHAAKMLHLIPTGDNWSSAKMLHRPTGDNWSAWGIWPVAEMLHLIPTGDNWSGAKMLHRPSGDNWSTGNAALLTPKRGDGSALGGSVESGNAAFLTPEGGYGSESGNAAFLTPESGNESALGSMSTMET